MRKLLILLVLLLIVCASSMTAHALFLDRGNGLIYDTDLDITWLQDLNHAMTSGYDADGLMDWNQAVSWAENLIVNDYDGWRLPTFDPANTRPVTPTSANEIGSLLLALSGGTHNIYSSTDVSPFMNLQVSGNSWYWTGLGYDASGAWRYSMSCGWWDVQPMVNGYYAMAVRDGDVSAVPEPSTILFLGTGLLAFVTFRRKSKK